MAEQDPIVDDPIVQMIRDRFNNVDKDNTEMLTCLKDHIQKDEKYWKKIDTQEAQIRLIKWLAGSGLGTAIGAWFYNTFRH